ncbi:hypothetical protein [Alloprevotella tannerae]|uniref:hypothetical protein n=1 Tax=Alloprevotella tannerae TaxID=76122 RepID=UPI0028E7D6F0|nr:hypothetical protein [Alloprevotella tannerae]
MKSTFYRDEKTKTAKQSHLQAKRTHAKSGRRRAQKTTRYGDNGRESMGGQNRWEPEKRKEKKNEWAAFLTAQRANTFGRIRKKA